MSRWWRTDGETADGMDDADAQTLETMPIGLLELDTDWTVRFVNAAAEQMVGYARADLLGRSYWDAFPANVDNEFGRGLPRRPWPTRQPRTLEAFYPEPLNQWFEVHAVPTPQGLWLYFSEVTARRQAVERLALLARVSDDLVGTLNAPAAVGRIPRLIVPALASWATVSLLTPRTAGCEDAGAWHVDPAKVPLVRRYAAAARESSPTTAPLLRAVTTGTPVSRVRRRADRARRSGPSATGEARRLLEVLDPGTHDGAARSAGPDRVLGVLTLVHDRHRAVEPADLATATEVADRAGLALDNARLYEQQRQPRRRSSSAAC